MNFPIAFLAAILDRYLPTFPRLVSKVGHPVIWQGRIIQTCDKFLNKKEKSSAHRRLAGIFMLALLLAITLLISLLLVYLVSFLPFPQLWEALLASTLLAQKSLKQAVQTVGEGLKTSLEAGREAVSHIVGRDTARLDEHEISRAAIESLAENSSDGFIAPLFYLALFGLPGIALYKAINTADSMVGHKNEIHMDFGWASARLDDVVNWIPARLSAFLYGVAAGLTSPVSLVQSWQAARRDAPEHISPNAGWPEAAMAGALGFGLGGPRAYRGQMLDLPVMGRGRRDLRADDIDRALVLYAKMTGLATLLTGLAALAFIVLS